MKTKGIINKLLIFVLLLFTACSSSGDNLYEKKWSQEIVGVWKSLLSKNICPLSSEIIYDYSNCQQKSAIAFIKDGTYR